MLLTCRLSVVQRSSLTSSHQVPEDDTVNTSASPEEEAHISTPISAPPSFRSRATSLASRQSQNDDTHSDAERMLAEAFNDGEGSDGEQGEEDDRQRLIRQTTGVLADDARSARPGRLNRRITEIPSFVTSRHYTSSALRSPSGIVFHPNLTSSNDGVFANLDAKPELGEKLEEQPPVRRFSNGLILLTNVSKSYEQAAADATPPYWETTIMAPGLVSDEVYVDGLPVGSLFSFVWNGVISMSFQLVGFLLTYLLHTTHAAKNGSRAGLGITLIQYGFYMKSSASRTTTNPDPRHSQPLDPNSHDFDPSAFSNSAAASVAAMASAQTGSPKAADNDTFPAAEWFAYMLMIVGWFVLIRSVTDFVKARRHEQLVLQSPERGLNIPVVAEGESADTVV